MIRHVLQVYSGVVHPYCSLGSTVLDEAPEVGTDITLPKSGERTKELKLKVENCWRDTRWDHLNRPGSEEYRWVVTVEEINFSFITA
ncbi:hypothetical protein KW800_00445 [Candidatus Parcubacteria bacterium]|nr:hypothetical protein [Candidatus Parcubacteria bacterium]